MWAATHSSGVGFPLGQELVFGATDELKDLVSRGVAGVAYLKGCSDKVYGA